jgi:hypothetical protein
MRHDRRGIHISLRECDVLVSTHSGQGRDQSWEDEMKEWHALTGLMAYRFMDGPSPALVVAAIFCIEGGVLIANYLYHFISDGLLINLLIVIPGLIYFPSRIAPPKHALEKNVLDVC